MVPELEKLQQEALQLRGELRELLASTSNGYKAIGSYADVIAYCKNQARGLKEISKKLARVQKRAQALL